MLNFKVMRKVKIFILLLIVAILYGFLSSCEEMFGDYLEKPPGVDVTVDTIFSSPTQVETAITNLYNYDMGGFSIFPIQGGAMQWELNTAYTDEGISGQVWTFSNQYHAGTLTASGMLPIDRAWGARFRGIRHANIILERVDDVPGMSQQEIDEAKGQARFIRALRYFEMFKRYGGMPIIRESMELSDDFFVGRNTIQEVVDFIVEDCDAAIGLLPDMQPVNMFGRASKGAALMLKSRTLLYAASPLFNTGTPYMNMDNIENNNLICFGDYNIERWQAAADAAKACLDWAEATGHHLITDKGIDENYRFMHENDGNAEIILASRIYSRGSAWTWPWVPFIIWSPGHGSSMTYNFLQLYERQNGTNQTWDPTGGDNLTEKLSELDRRFHQSTAPVGSYWNDDIPLVSSFVGGELYNGCFGGTWITKFCPRAMRKSGGSYVPNDIVFRLGEAYLNYAEALNEAQGPVPEAYAAINTIRARSGQPDLPQGLSQEEFRERVRNERAIELMGEFHRQWDINRWLVAEDILNGEFKGFRAYRNPEPPNFRYEVYNIGTRVFPKRQYLLPLLRDEVLKKDGYLIQNPGWN
jgi:hypothetical protein